MRINLIISSIVEHIVGGSVRRAVGLWKALRDYRQECWPCYYSPIDVSTRCATCLESYFSQIELSHSYPEIKRDQLTLAQCDLAAWIKSTQD